MSGPKMNGLGQRTALGAGLLILSRLGAKLIDLVTLIALTHMLTPDDFGLVAIAMTLVQICEAIFELPVAQVLVRADEVTQPLLHTALTLGALRGLILGTLLALSAWPFAMLYGDARIAPLICFLALAPILRGLVSPAMVHFTRNMDFRPDVSGEIIGKALALLLAACVALATHSYWAIATASVASPLFLALISYLWAPMRPGLRLTDWRIFAHFLSWTSAAQLFSALNWQADRLILARFIPRAGLGLFSMASDLAALPDQALLKPTMRTFLPALSQKKDDPEALTEAYLSLTCCVFAMVAPVVVALSLLAEPIVRLVLGAKWLGVAPCLSMLAPVLLLFTIYNPLSALAIAVGRPEASLRLTLVEFLVRIPLTLLAAWCWGLTGAIVVRALVGAVALGNALMLLRALIGLHPARVLVALARPMAAACAMAMLLLIARPWLSGLAPWPLGAGLMLCGGAAMLLYALAMTGLWHSAGCPSGGEARLIAMGTAVCRKLLQRGSAALA
ncbi:oligosaccharide flippase family protein [Novosphingobium terrae]|uniref:oligosaccharide flippase family protein n=1 Tax=Novosphingobium terrae TaxID=2726189 RepID=UPI00197EBDAE|nr:oligosaccharide flippase family protein [Novosphingobium terrae]